MSSLFAYVLSKLVRTGNLEVETADGVKRRFGDGSGPDLAVRFNDRGAQWRLMMDPSMALGEMFMDGRIDVVRGDLYDLLEMGARNLAAGAGPRWIAYLDKFRTFIRDWHQRNDRPRARRNISSHYDLDHGCTICFSMRTGNIPAPISNIRAKAWKMRSLPRSAISSRRCWSTKVIARSTSAAALAAWVYISPSMTGARVVGVTLSTEQQAIASRALARSRTDRARRFPPAGLSRRRGAVRRIVSVGMFEHVGGRGFRRIFLARQSAVERRWRHAVARDRPQHAARATPIPGSRKYIFPGGYIPAVSEVLAAIERQGLLVTDIEILRLHYADTLKAWRERFNARRDEAKAMYDERFCRMWEFLSRGIGERLPRRRQHGVPHPDRQAAGRRAAHRNYIADREEAVAAARGLGRDPVPPEAWGDLCSARAERQNRTTAAVLRLQDAAA